jgi:hypothetical protein
MIRRAFFTALLTPLAFAAPAGAQIMPDNGIDFSFFRSRQEKLAREACEKNLPECRADIRRQMQDEKGISLLTPWILLGLGILGVLLYARKREKSREQHRKEAARKHVPGQFKTLDKLGDEKSVADQY